MAATGATCGCLPAAATPAARARGSVLAARAPAARSARRAVGAHHAPAGGAAARRCAPNLANHLARDAGAGAGQIVTVEAPSYSATVATLTAWQDVRGCFVRVAGPWPAHVGRSGLSDHHVEGDGTTPTGAYAIGPTMYGTAPNPGVRYAYHRLRCGDWWDEDPASRRYNTFEHVTCGTTPPFGGDSEALWTEVPAYVHFAVVEYNARPVVAGRGSAIFLHVSTGTPTDGCVSLPLARLDLVLRWLRPGLHPIVAIGTAAGIASL